MFIFIARRKPCIKLYGPQIPLFYSSVIFVTLTITIPLLSNTQIRIALFHIHATCIATFIKHLFLPNFTYVRLEFALKNPLPTNRQGTGKGQLYDFKIAKFTRKRVA